MGTQLQIEEEIQKRSSYPELKSSSELTNLSSKAETPWCCSPNKPPAALATDSSCSSLLAGEPSGQEHQRHPKPLLLTPCLSFE